MMYSEEPGDLFSVISDDSVERALSLEENQMDMTKLCKIEEILGNDISDIYDISYVLPI